MFISKLENFFALKAWFFFLVTLSQLLGIVSMILIIVYFGYYGGGFTWQSNPSKEFNLHPVLMTLGFMLLYGDAILVYRIFLDISKPIVKIIHAVLLALALISASIGLKAVFDSTNLATPPGKNLSSLHAWIGITTVILFGLQWIFGFLFFLFPQLSADWRKFYMTNHRFWGSAIFTLALVAVISGITEVGAYGRLYTSTANLSQRDVLNVAGFFFAAFTIIILFLVYNPDYKRPTEKSPEQMPLKETSPSSYQPVSDQ